MIRYRPTTCDRRFKAITVSVEVLNALVSAEDDPTYIRAGGLTDGRLPSHVQAFHLSRYYDRLGEIQVDRMAQRPVVRLSDDDERQEGRPPVIVVDGLETIAALRDAAILTVEVEVPWWQRQEIEARLINMGV